MCSVQGSERPADLIIFDKVFIIATLHSIINFQGKHSLGLCFSILTKHYNHLKYLQKQNKTKILTMTNSEYSNGGPDICIFKENNAI